MTCRRGRLAATLAEVKQRADEELAHARQQRELGEDTLGMNLGGLLLGLSDGQAGVGGGRGCCANCRVQTASDVGRVTAGDQPTVSAEMQFCGVCAPQPAVDASKDDRANAMEVVRSPEDQAKPTAREERHIDSTKNPEEGSADEEAQEGAPLLTGSEVVCRNFRELLWYWQEYYLRRGRDRLSIEFSSHIPFRYWQSVVGEDLGCVSARSVFEGTCPWYHVCYPGYTITSSSLVAATLFFAPPQV